MDLVLLVIKVELNMLDSLDKEGGMEKGVCTIMENPKLQNGKMIFLFLSCDCTNIYIFYDQVIHWSKQYEEDRKQWQIVR